MCELPKSLRAHASVCLCRVLASKSSLNVASLLDYTAACIEHDALSAPPFAMSSSDHLQVIVLQSSSIQRAFYVWQS